MSNVTIQELIDETDKSKLFYQWLNPCLTLLNSDGELTEVSFLTDTSSDMNGLAKVGLVVWFDRDELEAFMERHQ